MWYFCIVFDCCSVDGTRRVTKDINLKMMVNPCLTENLEGLQIHSGLSSEDGKWLQNVLGFYSVSADIFQSQRNLDWLADGATLPSLDLHG